MHSGRSKPRGLVHMGANLQSRLEPAWADTVIVENISAYGARVRTRRKWVAHERVDLQPAFGDEPLEAEVVYCERLADSNYAVGLRFAQAVAW